MPRCKEITLKKTRCKNSTKINGLCWLHNKLKMQPKVYKADDAKGKVPKSMEKFILAQDLHYETAKSELKAGHKQSHWIWFIFPQLKGLGKSAMSDKYGIKDNHEAQIYMGVPILKKRYLELVDITYDWLVVKNLNPYLYVGGDVVKLKSSLELFQTILNSSKIDAILKKL